MFLSSWGCNLSSGPETRFIISSEQTFRSTEEHHPKPGALSKTRLQLIYSERKLFAILPFDGGELHFLGLNLEKMDGKKGGDVDVTLFDVFSD